MNGTDGPGYDALSRLFPRFTESQVDSAWLAGELLSKQIVGLATVQYAANRLHEPPDRLRRIVLDVLGSGKRRVFSDLITILLKKPEYSWLADELSEAYIEAGGSWDGEEPVNEASRGAESRTSQLSLDGSPNLLTLEKFPGANGPINIPEQIAAHYQVFGIFLLNDTTGALVSAIRSEYFHVPIDITRAILRRWLQTGDPSTVTWRALVQCLRDSELTWFASEIERGLVE